MLRMAILVHFCLHIKPKTRQRHSFNNFKEYWEKRRRKQWLRRLIPTIFMLYRTWLKVSHPYNARGQSAAGHFKGSRRVRVQPAACGLLSGRRALEATRLDTSQQEVLRMVLHGWGGGYTCCLGRPVPQGRVLQKPGHYT